ncbi:hypothetical protein BH09VER1_BH09VER1_13480 [soil metagenome]
MGSMPLTFPSPDYNALRVPLREICLVLTQRTRLAFRQFLLA